MQFSVCPVYIPIVATNGDVTNVGGALIVEPDDGNLPLSQQLSQLQRTVLSLQSHIVDLQEEVMNTRSFLELWKPSKLINLRIITHLAVSKGRGAHDHTAFSTKAGFLRNSANLSEATRCFSDKRFPADHIRSKPLGFVKRVR